MNSGNLLTATDALNNATSFTYNAQGQMKTVTVPGNRTRTFNYNGAGDLVSSTDALGNETLLTPDQVGRTVKITDALGFDTQRTFNPVDQVTQVRDANLGVTQLAYDAKRELASVTNALNVQIESYQYDELGRLTQKTDAKAKSAIYQYDAAGNLSQMMDRRGQVIRYGYDTRNRPTRVDYPDSAQTRSYDAAGRLAEVREADNAMTYAYDGVNRLVKATTDSVAGRQEVGYEYDTLDRVVRRTLNGADPTLYTYDNASRLTTINYRNQTTPGPDEGNALQYTARENDRTGLYFYRARYYAPVLKRFVSEDPIGMAAGTNFYAYVDGDPVNYIDPLGLAEIPTPPSTLPRGPYTPRPGDRPGAFQGPAQPAGGRVICQWVPPGGQGGPPGSVGYWKLNFPGVPGWIRFNQTGTPITPGQAHGGPREGGSSGGGRGGSGGGSSGGGSGRAGE